MRAYYASQGVRIVRDEDQYSTDLMKCIGALVEDEKTERHVEVPKCNYHRLHSTAHPIQQNTIVLLGGLSGRLDQTVHTLSLVHKLRKSRKRTFVITDDNVAWLLDTVRALCFLNHIFTDCFTDPGRAPYSCRSRVVRTHLWSPSSGNRLDHSHYYRPPVESQYVQTTTPRSYIVFIVPSAEHPSSFDGMVSTSNHLLPEEPVVTVRTTKPIWWTMELRPLASRLPQSPQLEQTVRADITGAWTV